MCTGSAAMRKTVSERLRVLDGVYFSERGLVEGIVLYRDGYVMSELQKRDEKRYILRYEDNEEDEEGEE